MYRVSSNKSLLECGDIYWNRIITSTFAKFGVKNTLRTLERLIILMIQMGDFDSLKKLKLGLYKVVNTVGNGIIFNLTDNDLNNYDLQLANVFGDSVKHSMLSFSKFNILPLKQCYDNTVWN